MQVHRKTKIIVTAGPSVNEGNIRKLILAGMDVLRVNMAHMTEDDVGRTLGLYRATCEDLGRLPCVLCVLRGGELRSSWLLDKDSNKQCESVGLKEGDDIIVYGSNESDRRSFVGWCSPSDKRIGLSFEKIGDVAPVGTVISVGDGSVNLEVHTVSSPTEIIARVQADCILLAHQAAFIRSKLLRMPSLGADDAKALKFAASQGVNFVAMPFARSQDDIEDLRDTLRNVRGGSSVRYVPYGS
jgi:pyruvate kinase